jgi:hypothetical protein
MDHRTKKSPSYVPPEPPASQMATVRATARPAPPRAPETPLERADRLLAMAIAFRLHAPGAYKEFFLTRVEGETMRKPYEGWVITYALDDQVLTKRGTFCDNYYHPTADWIKDAVFPTVEAAVAFFDGWFPHANAWIVRESRDRQVLIKQEAAHAD